MRGRAYRAGAFAEDTGGGGGVETDDDAEQDRLGLVARKSGDEPEGVLRGEDLQRLVGGAVRAGQVQYVLFERRPWGRVRLRRSRSRARLRAMVAVQPRKPAPSPLKRPRSREISSQASDATSSASSPTSPRR